MKTSSFATNLADLNLIVGGRENFTSSPQIENYATSDSMKQMHNHIYYEVFFVTDVPLIIYTDNERKVFLNEIVIVPPHFKHYAEGAINAFKPTFYRLTVSPNAKIMTSFNITNLFKTDDFTVIPLQEDLLPLLKRLSKINQAENNGKAKLDALLHLILLELSDLLTKTKSSNESDTDAGRYSYVDKIDSYVNQIEKALSIKELASIMYLSEKQVSRIIKAEYGCTFTKLVNDRKMIAAAALLKNSTYPISTIISLLGFETENYFYRVFKNYYNTTPLQFRKNSKK